MRHLYGDKTFLRVLDEAEFWKRQEAEHNVVIRNIVPGLEDEYVRQLQNWEQAFSQTQAAAERYMEAVIRSGSRISPYLHREIMGFINFCICQSQEFVQFLNLISSGSAAIRDNPVAPMVIDHIRLESEYFTGIAIVITQMEQGK